MNAVPSVIALAGAKLTGGQCTMNSNLFWTCTGATFPYFSGGTTWGNTFVANPEYFTAKDLRENPELITHEEAHAWDSAIFTPFVFYGSYPLVGLVQGRCNVWEKHADFAAGGYDDCVNESVVAPGVGSSGQA
jgi:hypothetical protein